MLASTNYKIKRKNMKYQVILKQLVSFSRCRIYRKFLMALSKDQAIRTGNGSFLFYYMLICSLANIGTGKVNFDGISYTVLPGECFISIRELSGLFRLKTEKRTLCVLDSLRNDGCISYIITNNGSFVKIKITDWEKFNKNVKYPAPCQKEQGFFFFPYSKVADFIGRGKCSEMDIILDLWLNTVYNDDRIAGSDVGPVVYYRNGTDIEQRAKSIERSNKMLNLIDGAVKLMREKNKNGEIYYRVIYYNYLSPNQLHSNDDIVLALTEAGYPMCRKTMTDHRAAAVDCISSILWGYTARDSGDILDELLKKHK